MAKDRIGKVIATGQNYLVAGTVRRIDGNSVLIVIGDGEKLVHSRVKAGDVVSIDDLCKLDTQIFVDLQTINNTPPSTGDIMYNDGANWVLLPIGAEGAVLTVADGVPKWVGP